ncbi:respiratory nitrate reductase subunit gamma [Desulforudis sp. 1088]|uniref:respiratory nitrate reductase subunit gamma n=1 Tax=unclassified Candidatus Desulforudis TaxID=2635950 RepID=UPI003CE52990
MEVFVGQILPYITVAIFLGGITWRIWRWMIPRIVHNITLSPFPSNWVEAVMHPVVQLLTMWNVLKFDRGLWIGAFLLHFSLINILGGHVTGFYWVGEHFHVWAPNLVTLHQSELASDFLGTVFGWLLFAAILILLYRRFAVEKVKLVSATSDYLHLFLLLTIVSIGNWMRNVPDFSVPYQVARDVLAGLFTFNPVPLPDNPFFLYHFLFVQILMIIFPFSKLMHTFGMFWERWIVNRPYREAPRGLPGAQIQP